MSSFDSTLSNLTFLQRKFLKYHAGFQVDHWNLSLPFYSPDILNFLSTSALPSITDAADGDGDGAEAPVRSTSARRC